MARLLEFELGLTAATRRNIRLFGVSDPDDWSYVPYSQVRARGDGRSIGFGFPVASWIWNSLDQYQVAQLLSLFASSTDASVVVSIQTYKDDGVGQAENLVAYSTAILHRPVDGEGKTMISGSRNPGYSDVTLRFTRLET
jgi:hypothetical protein